MEAINDLKNLLIANKIILP